MFEEADNFADIFRGGLPYYLLLALPVLIICSSAPVLGATELRVHRMSQFDLGGVAYGCRASALSLEAKSLDTWSTARHCVVSKLKDLSVDQFREIRQKAGGLVVLLPRDMSILSAEEKENIYFLESTMLTQPISIPIYFSHHTDEMEQVVQDISRTSASTPKVNHTSRPQSPHQQQSVLSEIFTSVAANGYQVIVSGGSHVVNKNAKIPIIQGEIAPNKYWKSNADSNDAMHSKLPVVVLVAHLNTFGIYNEYPSNADAAGLLAIAELFSKLYNSPNAAPKVKLLFLLTESGPLLNFQGMRKWLDDNVQLQDDLVSVTGNLLVARKEPSLESKNVDFVLCLDTIAMSATNAETSAERGMFMHVSKPPKEGTPINDFYKILQTVANNKEALNVEGVHKKINLAETFLSWEHERFSIKRLPAFTLSALKSTSPLRTTVFTDPPADILQRTQKSVEIVAEALVRYIYGIDSSSTVMGDNEQIFNGTIHIDQSLLKSYMNVRSALHNNDLKNFFEKYLKNVKVSHDKPDMREPEFLLFEGEEATLNIYRVKPAIFDLLLTVFISAYLSAVYFAILYFPHLYKLVCSVTLKSAASAHNQAYAERSAKAKAN